MDPITALTALLALAAIILGARAILGGSAGLVDLFRPSWNLGWPHGVQEEEPVRYRLEHVRRLRRAAGQSRSDTPTSAARSPRRMASVRMG